MILRGASAVLLAVGLGIAACAGGLPDDLKPLALEVYGLRGAWATSPTTVTAVLGASVGGSHGDPEAWRVMSEDDPAYGYAKFVRPKAVRILSEKEEFAPPAGFTAPEQAKVPLVRHEVELEMPSPLKPGCRYGLVAQGKDVVLNTAAKTGTWFAGRPVARGDLAADRLAPRIVGLRRVSGVGDGKILLEFGAGFSEAGGNDLSAYRVTVNGKPRPVFALGRRSVLDAYWCKCWPYKAIRMHDVFLDLGAPLKDGDAVEVAVSDRITSGARTASFRVGDTHSRAVQVNQIGYLAKGPKIAYLSCWLGSFPDAAARNAPENPTLYGARYANLAPWAVRFGTDPEFEVVEASSGRTCWSGRARLRSSGNAPDTDRSSVRQNLSSLNVWELDFTAFERPGRYRLRVKGVGTSWDFDLGDDVYARAFRLQGAGVYAQRCGLALEPRYADGWRRIACHAKGITASTVRRWDVREFAKFDEAVEKGADGRPKVLKAFGGHHDAGDFNPRSHIDVAQVLLWAYELAPRKFADGQLNIPEAGNGIPDIVDEALWAVRLWEGLQDADGGVYDGTESLSDPCFTQTVELDDKGDYAFAKDSKGSFLAAGVFAAAARACGAAGRKDAQANFTDRARRAYSWAKAHKPDVEAKRLDEFWTAPLLYAAAELFHTTGDAAYHRDFLNSCGWRDNAWQEVVKQGEFDHLRAAFSYTLIPREKADPKTWDAVLAAIRREADMHINFISATRDYPFMVHPWVPMDWGFAAMERYAEVHAHLWALTGDEKYLRSLVRTVDNTLGANPMDTSWIVGAGTKTVRAPLHNSHYRPDGLAVVGTQAQGPCCHPNKTCYAYLETAYPAHRSDHASLNAFADAHFAIMMDEGFVSSQVQTMAVFGLLCPGNSK